MIGRREFIGASLASACGAPLLGSCPIPCSPEHDSARTERMWKSLPPIMGEKWDYVAFRDDVVGCYAVIDIPNVEALREERRYRELHAPKHSHFAGMSMAGLEHKMVVSCSDNQRDASVIAWAVSGGWSTKYLRLVDGNGFAGMANVIPPLMFDGGHWRLVDEEWNIHDNTPENRKRRIVALVAFTKECARFPAWQWAKAEAVCEVMGVAFRGTQRLSPKLYQNEWCTFAVAARDQKTLEAAWSMAYAEKTNIVETEPHAVK